MTHLCAFCERPADPTRPGTYREVSGWEQVRKGGGANAITLRTESGRVACSSCVDRIKRGISPRQSDLFT